MKMGTKFWLAHVAAAKLETISASAYAKRHGISIASLYYWQSKLKKPIEIVESDSASKFVTLRVDKTVVAQPPFVCMLVLPSSMRLEMSALPAPEWLVALGRAAQGAH